jgi:uncharacterized protein (TIGR02284 family)
MRGINDALPLTPIMAQMAFLLQMLFIMSNTTTTNRKTLKNLIQILHDGRDGYRHASDQVNEAPLKGLFDTLATQRAQFAQELEPHLAVSGEEDADEQGGTVSGAVHRGWIDLKSALTKQDAHSILEEVERGEDVAKKAYRDALDETEISQDVRSVIQRQSTEILQAHDQIRTLRDATKKS